jgi:hypothetical protein
MNLEAPNLPSVLSTFDQVSAAVRHIYDCTIALEMPQTYFDSAVEWEFRNRVNKAVPGTDQLLAFGNGLAAAYLDVIRREHCEFIYILPSASIHKGGSVPLVESVGVYSCHTESRLPNVSALSIEQRGSAVGGLVWKVRSAYTPYLPFGVFATDEERIRSAAGH